MGQKPLQWKEIRYTRKKHYLIFDLKLQAVGIFSPHGQDQSKEASQVRWWGLNHDNLIH